MRRMRGRQRNLATAARPVASSSPTNSTTTPPSPSLTPYEDMRNEVRFEQRSQGSQGSQGSQPCDTISDSGEGLRRQHTSRMDRLKKRMSFQSRREEEPLREDELEIRVKSEDLEGGGGGLRKHSRLEGFRKKVEGMKLVRVEANKGGMAGSVLYASDEVFSGGGEGVYAETDFVSRRLEYVDKKRLVYKGDGFEIGVIGMSVSAKDFGGRNEVLLYSLQKEEGEEALPYIHYDPKMEEGGSTPDRFICVPASRGIFRAVDGGGKSVNVRFKVLELDDVDDVMSRSIEGIQELGKHLNQVGNPFAGLLSPALSLASIVGRRALESYAKPDRVLTIDMNFLLAEKNQCEKHPVDGSDLEFEHCSGEFLRYGYYFFLEDRVDAKLYASLRTFPNVELMLKRTERELPPGEKRFFPLTGVSYLCIRVTPRVTATKAIRKAVRLSHVQRLEELMRNSVSGADAQGVASSLATLAKDLGLVGADDQDSASSRGT